MGKMTGRLWKRAQEYDRDELKDKPSHSLAYHAFFQGYSERKVLRGNGKGYRIERIYTADYRKYAETDRMWRSKKLFYLAAYLLSVYAWIFGTSQASVLNTTRMIGVMELAALLPTVYLGYSMIFQLFAKRKMTVGEYAAASTHLKWGALAALCFTAMISFTMFFFKCFSGFDWNGTDLAAIGGLFGAALLFLFLYRMEAMRDTEWVKNPNEMPTDAIEIW